MGLRDILLASPDLRLKVLAMLLELPCVLPHLALVASDSNTSAAPARASSLKGKTRLEISREAKTKLEQKLKEIVAIWECLGEMTRGQALRTTLIPIALKLRGCLLQKKKGDWPQMFQRLLLPSSSAPLQARINVGQVAGHCMAPLQGVGWVPWLGAGAGWHCAGHANLLGCWV